jgi:hypothetical protein
MMSNTTLSTKYQNINERRAEIKVCFVSEKALIKRKSKLFNQLIGTVEFSVSVKYFLVLSVKDVE